MIGRKFALVRVSTEEQNETRQVKRMLDIGVPKQNILIEKESGKSTVRTEYKKFVKPLKVGDILYIENVDRLSRDYDGILDEWHKLTVKKGVIIKVLDTPLLDTDQTDNDLLFRLIRNIILHIMAFQAENEWHKIKSRQAQGIAVAKASGKNCGRPIKARPKKQIRTAKQYLNDEIDFKTALALSKLKKSAFYNLLQFVSELQD